MALSPRVYHLTTLEKFRVWIELERTQLGMDVATYYGVCSVFGLISGLSIGYSMVQVIRMI